jgi:hypothetical protein
MQIPCVYLPGPAPAVSVANNTVHIQKLAFIYTVDMYLHKPAGFGNITYIYLGLYITSGLGPFLCGRPRKGLDSPVWPTPRHHLGSIMLPIEGTPMAQTMLKGM